MGICVVNTVIIWHLSANDYSSMFLGFRSRKFRHVRPSIGPSFCSLVLIFLGIISWFFSWIYKLTKPRNKLNKVLSNSFANIRQSFVRSESPRLPTLSISLTVGMKNSNKFMAIVDLCLSLNFKRKIITILSRALESYWSKSHIVRNPTMSGEAWTRPILLFCFSNDNKLRITP